MNTTRSLPPFLLPLAPRPLLLAAAPPTTCPCTAPRRLSDPLKRLLSHLKFVTMQMKWDYRNNTLFHNTFTGTDSAFWEEFGPVLVDNYMLRCVGGGGGSRRIGGGEGALW